MVVRIYRKASGISELKNFSKSILQSFILHKFTKSEVSLAINDVKSNSAPGINGIFPEFIKMAKVALAPTFTTLYSVLKQ